MYSTDAFIDWLENGSTQLSGEKLEEMRLRDICCRLINDDFSFKGLTDDDLEALIIKIPMMLDNSDFYSAFCLKAEQAFSKMHAASKRRLL